MHTASPQGDSASLNHEVLGAYLSQNPTSAALLTEGSMASDNSWQLPSCKPLPKALEGSEACENLVKSLSETS